MDRAGAVTEQNVIGNPDRNFFLVGGVDRECAGKDTGFFFREICPLEITLARGAFAIFADNRPLLFGHYLINEGMFRSEHHVCRAVQSVGPRREDANSRVVTVDLEFDLGAFAAPDPVALE